MKAQLQGLLFLLLISFFISACYTENNQDILVKDGIGSSDDTEAYMLTVAHLYEYNADDIKLGDTVGTMMTRPLKNDPDGAFEFSLVLKENITAVDYEINGHNTTSPMHFSEFYKFKNINGNATDPRKLTPRILLGYNFEGSATASMIMVVEVVNQ